MIEENGQSFSYSYTVVFRFLVDGFICFDDDLSGFATSVYNSSTLTIHPEALPIVCSNMCESLVRRAKTKNRRE